MRLIDADMLLDRVEWANTNPLLDHGKTAVELIKNAPTIEKRVRMSEVRINLNEPVMVKLTDLGKEIYYHRFDDLNQKVGRTVLKPTFPAEDPDGYTEFQLWAFIELYGNHIGMTKPNVIKPLEIVYQKDG